MSLRTPEDFKFGGDPYKVFQLLEVCARKGRLEVDDRNPFGECATMQQWFLGQPAHVLWLLFGLGCLGVSLVAFEPTVAAFGLAAIITAIAAFSVPAFGVQLLIWGILSIALAVVMRGLVPKESKALKPPEEGEVSIAIPPGGEGEVSYEGTFWSARCQISDIAIPAGQMVQVVGRQGNTLIVMPTTYPNDQRYDQVRPRR